MTTFRIDGEDVRCEIVRKPNKNLVVRIRDDGTLAVTAPFSVAEAQIRSFLERHQDRIARLRRERLTRIKAPDGMVYRFGELIPRPAGFSETDYLADTLAAAKAALAELPAAARRFVPEGLVLRARRMTSRFGSCALRKHAITLNSALARFDRTYLKAILVHELVHFAHPDHGKGFYADLLAIVPEYRRLRRELGDLFRNTEV